MICVNINETSKQIDNIIIWEITKRNNINPFCLQWKRIAHVELWEISAISFLSPGKFQLFPDHVHGQVRT